MGAVSSKMKLLTVVALVGVMAVAGCRTAQVANVQSQTYGSSGLGYADRLTLEDYEKAIVKAGSKRGWLFSRVAPGHLVGTVEVRGKHKAVVDVMFDTKTFSILYKDSSHLNYDPATKKIHPNYNSWVKLLEQDIRAEIQALKAS